jgi:hypothetical protein
VRPDAKAPPQLPEPSCCRIAPAAAAADEAAPASANLLVLDLADGSSYVPADASSMTGSGAQAAAAAAAAGRTALARHASSKSLASGRVQQQAIFR